MGLTKKKKKTIIILASVVLVIGSLFGWIAIKVSQVKNKQATGLSLEEPTYKDGMKRAKGDVGTNKVVTTRLNLTEKMFADAEDSLAVQEAKDKKEAGRTFKKDKDGNPIYKDDKGKDVPVGKDRKDVKDLLRETEAKKQKDAKILAANEKKRKQAEAEQNKEPENALVAEMKKLEAAKNAKKKNTSTRKRTTKTQPKSNDDFGFNFVVVKEDTRYEVEEAKKKYAKDAQDDKTLFNAKIYGHQTVKAGESVILRNAENVVWRNQLIPEGSIFYGTTSIANNRLKISVNRVITKTGQYPVEMRVYDRDYQEGIFKKELFEAGTDKVGNDVTKSVSDNVPSQVIGSALDKTSKTIQKTLKKQNKASIHLEDDYEVYLSDIEVI
jgi:Conjugative transposon, TraM